MSKHVIKDNKLDFLKIPMKKKNTKNKLLKNNFTKHTLNLNLAWMSEQTQISIILRKIC